MDKTETQTKLEDIGHSLQYHQEEIAHHQLVIDGELEKAKKLEAELADTPKLRHGDYGYCGGGGERLYLKGLGGPNRYAYRDGMWNDHLTAEDVAGKLDDKESVILGNIFDDLKAIAEDIEFNKGYEFSCDSGDGDSLRLLLCHDGEVHFRGGVFLKNIKPIILCLRRMEATMKRAEQEQHGKEAGK